MELAARSPEGWLLVYFEKTCRDPWQHDDCWHEGTVFEVRIPEIGYHERTSIHGPIGSAYDKLEKACAEAGKFGTIEIINPEWHLRSLHTIYTAEQLEQIKEGTIDYAEVAMNNKLIADQHKS